MSKTKPKFVTVVAPQVVLGRHEDAVYEEIVSLLEGSLKLRIVIRSDAYDFQSQARIFVWKGALDGWTLVHAIHHAAMKTPSALGYKQDGKNLSHYSEDRDELLRVAASILL